MRSLSFSVILLFALMHLLGFFKAYELMRINEFSMAVSKPWGLIWLLCSVLLFVTAVLYHNRNSRWLSVGIVTVMVSQTLIFSFWADAMYGTIINALLIEMICAETSGKVFLGFNQRKEQE